MIKKTTLVAVTLAAISSIALAEDKAPAPAAAKPAAAAPKADAAAAANAPKMEAPKPPAENDMFKKVAGTWRCDSISTGPDGKDMKVKTSWTWKNALGGQWYTVVYKRTKTGPSPAFEGNATMGYNGADKKYVFVGFDNMGGWINLSSADGMSYAGDGLPMGKKGTIKIAFAKGKDKKGEESDKMMSVSLDLGGHPVSETCKK
jgi:hypothetical protein